jgi:uncharacterized integral membrane protein (TIGR00698 family)
MPILLRQIFFIGTIVLCLSPLIDPPLALLLGLIIAQTICNPFTFFNTKFTSLLLKISVVGLGFGMNFFKALEAGKEGIILTIFSISLTLIVGFFLGKWLKVDKIISFLISSGTAICGGSAIAAVAPIIKAKENQMSVALGTVFILNSLALFIFPWLGHLLNLNQEQFGLWAAIAIHDTSSVVGAASKFGDEALRIATTIKLERALWIIPLSFLSMFIFKGEQKKIAIPYFILFFCIAMILTTLNPEFKDYYSIIFILAKKGLTLTLFLIGSSLSLNLIKSVGAKPFIQAIIVWILISICSLLVIIN